jgi:hypothetical protein
MKQVQQWPYMESKDNMATTYEKIATTTLGSTATSITLGSIPNTYTDLRLVLIPIAVNASDYNVFIEINGTTSGYSRTTMYGTGSAAGSLGETGQAKWNLNTGTGMKSTPSLWTLDIFSYAGSTFKTALSTQQTDYNGSGYVNRGVLLWQNTSAITQLVITNDISSNFATGTTATLYGILKA